jgi:hypothetical protein
VVSRESANAPVRSENRADIPAGETQGASLNSEGSAATPMRDSDRASDQTEASASNSAEPTSPSAAPPTGSLLEQEMALMRRANALSQSGRPREALAVLAEHARRFPNGKLAESRTVAQIMALCAAGDAHAAHAEAEKFLAAHPKSPFAARVRSICASREN